MDEQPASFRDQLLFRMDPARVISLMAFREFAGNAGASIRRVAIVSGSAAEPELKFLAPGIDLTILDFEQSPAWDLCEDWGDGRLGQTEGTYDLVLCEQVMEHLPDPRQAFKNLALLLRPGGHAHVSVPGMNGTHGLPTYYYAGFHPMAIDALFEFAGFKSWVADGWGSNKAVMMYAITDWTPLFFSAFPKSLTRFKPRNFRDLFRGLHHFFRYNRHSFFPKSATHYVVSWGLGVK